MTDGALAGISVLDFTLAAVGPFCSRILADMGAEVIKVEWPSSSWVDHGGEESSRFTPEGVASGQHILFLHCNGGKRSLCINLKTEEGRDLIRSLIAKVDVVVENFTPRVMSGFELDYAHLRAINQALIMCSLSGYGQQGWGGNREHPCTDPIAQAVGGLSWITGERNGPPYAIGGGIGDTMTSMAGAIAICSALFHRQRTGIGQYIDLAMADTCAFVDCTTLPYVAANKGESIFFRNGQQNTYTFPMGPLRARNGYISLQAPGAGPASPWGRLCSAMGREELIADPRYTNDRVRIERTDEVVAMLEDWLASLPDDETALAILADARISSGPVLSQKQILEHPHFRERGMFQQVEYPELGMVEVVAPPYKMSETPAYVHGRSPELGEHNSDVLGRYLGLSKEDVARLTAKGVLRQSTAVQQQRAQIAR